MIRHGWAGGVVLAVATLAGTADSAGLAEPVQAQVTPPSPANPNAAPPDRVSPPQRAPRAVPQQPGSANPGEPLGDRLSRSQGTITPPSNIDPGMTAPPPPTGARSMPVIPPPGTPGGNPTVTPK